MATVTYTHIPGATVYHVDENAGVRKGVVKTVKIDILIAAQTIAYTVQMSDARDGLIDSLEAFLFADVDLALAYYKATYVII